MKEQDLKSNERKTVKAFFKFIRDTQNAILPYCELVDKFKKNEDVEPYKPSIVNEEEYDYFDFDFGEIGGSFHQEDDEAILDCLQVYREDEYGDIEDPEDIDLDSIKY